MSELGKKIRDARKLKKITLVELAKLTNVAQASLSRIETGVMTGTIESHKKIAEALGISLSDLYEGLDTRTSEIAHVEPKDENITLVTDAVKLEVLTANTANKKIIPLLFTLAAGSETKTDQLKRGVERFYWVLEGQVTAVINDKEYLLQNKHSIYFDASLSHQIKNASSDTAKVFCATSPPRI